MPRKKANPQPTTSGNTLAEPTKKDLVEQLVDHVLPDTTPDFTEALEENPGWDLWELFLRRYQTELRIINTSSSDRRVDAFERFQRALPEAMRMEFRKYEDERALNEDAVREAAFAVGVAVGRRRWGVR